MNKRFLLCASLLTAVALAAGVPACGGSSSEDGGEAGHGGYVMDAATQDVSAQDVAADNTAADAVSESTPDVSQTDASQVDVEVLEGSLFDLNLPDVVINDAGATLQGCYNCAQTQCTNELASCEADDKCRTLILCFFLEGCVDPTQQIGVDFGCAMTCAGKAGISSLQDPSAAMGMSVASCLNTACQVECGIPPDAGLPDVQVDTIDELAVGPDAPTAD